MSIKEKIYSLIKDNTDEVLLSEIYQILKESKTEIILSETQLKRIDIAEEQIKNGEVIPHEEVLKRFNNE